MVIAGVTVWTRAKSAILVGVYMELVVHTVESSLGCTQIHTNTNRKST